MKLDGPNGQRLEKPNFSRKSSFLEKKAQNFLKIYFFAFCQKVNLLGQFCLKIVHNSVVYKSEKTTCLGKCGFSVMT